MRTAGPEIGFELTARSRMVRSALQVFAAEGYAAATIRDIAARADVSAALVTHHFGGKARLRAECDEMVEKLLARKRSGEQGPAEILTDAIDTYGPYLGRMLQETAPSASALFARLVDVAREVVAEDVAGGRMRPSADPEAQAVAVVLLGVAPFMLRARIDEWASDGEGLRRLAVPLQEIYDRGLFLHGEPASDADALPHDTRARNGESS